MTTETKILGIVLFVTVILLIGGVFLLSKNQSSQEVAGAAVLQIDYSKGEKVGSDSAKVKLVEFSDFQCPACQAAEPAIKKVIAENPDQVQFIYRHFPLPQHANAKEAAYFAEAAGQQGKFWEMHDKIFETQDKWSNLPSSEATAFFLSLGQELGLDENKIKQAVQESSLRSMIEEDTAEGRRLGVNSTPTFFLNGRKLNLRDFNDLNTAVAEELKK